MSEHREQVDLAMMRQVNRRVLIPLLLDMGSRYLVKPYIVKYDDEAKTANWRFGSKRHGDKRHRTSVTYAGITYNDGEIRDGKTYQRVEESYSAWSVKHDNRLVQNDETISKKVVSYEETYNQIDTFSSLDLMQRFTATAQGEIAGIGGSVTTTTEARAHTELKTQKYDRQRREVVLDTSAHICYPGPVYRDDYDEDGRISGRTLVQEGEIWFVDRPIEVIHTVTPVEQEGTWDAAITLDLYDWAGYRGPLPRGEHDNKFKFANMNELLSFMRRELVLQYKWLPKLKLSDESKRGLNWLADEANRRVGPVHWSRVRVNENVAALEPSRAGGIANADDQDQRGQGWQASLAPLRRRQVARDV